MVNVLLVDPDQLAQRAMKGVLSRGGHRFAVVNTAQEAWDFVRQNVKVDLILTELKLKEDSGLALIQRLKSDFHFRLIPVVVYTAHGDKASVKQVLGLRVQNFLLKPYRDEIVFAEIAKATINPWRQRHFANEELFCERRNITPDQLKALLDDLRDSFEQSREPLDKMAYERTEKPLLEALKALSGKAARAGAVGAYACLKYLNEKVVASDWPGFEASLGQIDFAAALIFHHLNPSLIPDEFLTPEELNTETEAQERTWWANAPEEDRCPVVAWGELQRKIEGLSGCPVAESIVASFQMSANGRPTSLVPLLDLVNKDPGLTAQVLIASNKLKKGKSDGDSDPIEEPRMAVGLLGELRLASLGGSMIVVEERHMLAPPHSSWPNFRMFQLGTARLARFVCNYLEMPGLEASAYTAGLLHDIGKLLLVHFYPYAFLAIQDYALRNGVKLAAAERLFLGVTTLQMATHFAEKQGLPRRFANVMRWMDNPEDATEDAELVAIVSLARDLCRQNHVGFCGDTPKDEAVPIAETPEWQVLRNRVFLNFDLKKFETEAHRECLNLKRELLGRVSSPTLA